MFHFYENLIYTSKVLLDKLKVKYSLKNLIFILHSHPNYPSLLSLSDALNEHRIRNKILKVENSKFLNIPRPFVTLIDCDIKEFVVVESIEKNIVNYNLNNKRFSIPIDKFLSIWNNIILVAMPTSLSGDPNYIINNKIDFI